MIRTRDDKGNPCCPICEVLVSQAGEFCSRGHYIHYIVAVSQMPSPVEVEDAPLDARSQSWYAEVPAVEEQANNEDTFG